MTCNPKPLDAAAQRFASDAPEVLRAELGARVGEQLLAAGMSLSTVESCTGGLISAAITSAAGSSRYFLEGHCTYSNESKVRCCGVDADVIAEKGAVSREVATAMARGVRLASGSDFALSSTGIAGPGGGSPHKPVGTVFISLSHAGGETTRHLKLEGLSRGEVVHGSAMAALTLLSDHLNGAEYGSDIF